MRKTMNIKIIIGILVVGIIVAIVAVQKQKEKDRFDREVRSAKFSGELKRMKEDLDNLKDYLSWEAKMKSLLFRLNYTKKQMRHEIDSVQQNQIFKYQKEWPEWYKDYLRTRDSL